ncbi:MAG: Arm DNA-binding domain-containing protein [Sodalis sp. (in: enterobacteria)]|uniref:Arm DNA-binding domain-containing protein n=1 Tax=Sodalis sp. (in: enterobacteria) TaxID=1898979 RepID=UPI0039E44FC5
MGGKQADSIMPRGVAIHGKSLRITFHYKGQRCRESLRLPPTKSNIKYATGKLAAINHEIKSGVFLYHAHFPESERALQFDGSCKRAGIRLNTLCDEYKALKYTDIGHAAQRRYDIAFNQCLSIFGPSRLIDAICPEDIMRLRSELLNTRAASTTNHYMAAMRGFLRFAEQDGYTKNHLANELRPAKKSTSDPDPFTLDEFRRAQAACTHESNANIITLMVYTGMRPGEISALAWEDIDLVKKNTYSFKSIF